MDHKNNAYWDCQNDPMRISVGTSNMQIIKQQQKPFKCHKVIQQMGTYLF